MSDKITPEYLDDLLSNVAGVPCRFCMGLGNSEGPCPECDKPRHGAEDASEITNLSATISTLPVWKKGATPAEWLSELAACALARPSEWGRIVVIFEKVGEHGGSIETRSLSYKCETNTLKMGTLACAIQEVFEEMKGRR